MLEVQHWLHHIAGTIATVYHSVSVTILTLVMSLGDGNIDLISRL